MAGFIHFWKGMTPADYYALSIAENNAMFAHMDEVHRARKQANDRARAMARRNARRGR